MAKKLKPKLIIARRVTTTFIQAIPEAITHFDASIYAIVKRKKDLPNRKWGTDVRLDPVNFDWDRKTITITIPRKINYGIESINDLDPNFFEALEATFISLMVACL